MSWKEWSYPEWNKRLIDHHFRSIGSSLEEGDALERVPATPEELAVVAGESAADPADVAKAFIGQIVVQLPKYGRSFCGFCLDYGKWRPDSADPPHFFGMLWFTCLVAYGYGISEGIFYKRISHLLGKRDNLQFRGQSCLPALWEDLRDWARNRRAAGIPIRELVLPPEVGIRTSIGYSWFLAFPHRLDRKVLAKCLWDAGLVGFEPPIQPVLMVLESKRRSFSKEFQEDLDDFISRFVNGGEEPRSSAFWRAVRQEALEPSVYQDGEQPERGPRTGLIVMDSEEGLRPLICCPAHYRPPNGFEKLPLDEPIGSFSHFLVASDRSLDKPAQEALNHRRLLGLAHRKLVEQGVLMLREHSTTLFTTVSGSEAQGASMALVRADVVDAFVSAFGGRRLPSLVEGWIEVIGCRVHEMVSLPRGLESVLQLLPTMQTPILSVAGGIRVPGGFFFFESFLPSLRASGADRVSLLRPDGTEVACARRAAGEDEWDLPVSSVPRQGDVVARAAWSIESAGIRRERVAEARLRFVPYALDEDFKGLGSGHYFIEACAQPEIAIVDGAIPVGITSDDGACSADVLMIEADARYLGPGLGEMSLHAASGFDWLAVGPKKHPDFLLFVGNPEHPQPPTMRRSLDGGDRRHWRSAFSNARQILVRLPEGQYRSMSEYPKILAAYSAYRNHDVPDGAPTCARTDLETRQPLAARATSVAETTVRAVDALVALAARRSGLPYQDVKDIFSTVLDSNDPLAIQQVIRGWVECGFIDVVRDARMGRLTIVARRPRLVMVRRGPDVEATVLGLVGSLLRERMKDALARGGAELEVARVGAPNPWQPPLIRVRGAQRQVEEVGRVVGLGASMWLDWPDASRLPAQLDVDNAYRALPVGDPPHAFKPNATWDWAEAVFRRKLGETETKASVVIERRIHPDGSSLYVVLGEDGRPFCWTFIQNWALLVGYDLRGQPPFSLDALGRLASSGRSPAHLPLPIARLCALVGAGLPGPIFKASPSEIESYVYPFGHRLYRLISSAIPRNWLTAQRG